MSIEERWLQRYGRELVELVIDSVLITHKQPKAEVVRHLLIKQGIITQSTKTIRAEFYRCEGNRYRPAEWVFQAKNGRGETKVRMNMQKHNIDNLMEELRNEPKPNQSELPLD